MLLDLFQLTILGSLIIGKSFSKTTDITTSKIAQNREEDKIIRTLFKTGPRLQKY